MHLSIDPRAATPPYEQIRQQILALIRTDALHAGTRLPTVRQLAGDLGVAINTVAHAYRALEHDQLIQTRGRRGTYVAAKDAIEGQAQQAAAAYAHQARRLGLKPVEALRLVRLELGLPG
ncbi:MAG TPA: GntR family transcriptional regulator [Actinomycetes bacterium]|nr:GntR family transcriptional regulator [Actinomycetes bacterium]